MAEQHDFQNEMVAEQLNEKTSNKLEKARTADKVSPSRTNASEKMRHKSEKVLVEDQQALSDAGDKVERRARIKAKKGLSEMQDALAVAQSKIEQERQAQLQTERDKEKAERAVEEARTNTAGLEGNIEMLSKMLGNEEVERRVSFIVRLTLGEHNEPKRTEIEDTRTRKKESFQRLNTEQLATFMRSCISDAAIVKPAAPERFQAVKADNLIPESRRQRSIVAISDVQIFHTGAADNMTLVLSPEKALVIQIRFQLQDADAILFPEQQSLYEIVIYANRVGSTDSRLLTTYRGSFAKDALEYTVQVQAPGLLPGVYRLVTLITRGKPMKVAGYHEGPIVQFH